MLRVTVLCYFTKCRTLTYCGFTRYRMKDSNTQKSPKISTFSWQNETLQPPGGGRSNCFPQNFEGDPAIKGGGGRGRKGWLFVPNIFGWEDAKYCREGLGWVGGLPNCRETRQGFYPVSPELSWYRESILLPPPMYIYIYILYSTADPPSFIPLGE